MDSKLTKGVLIGLVVGIACGVGVVSTMKEEKPNDSKASQEVTTTDHNQQMTNKLKALKGDEFDKAFIEEMIMHHQGAIDMAGLAADNAQHAEIKELSQNIIKAQNKEITEMKDWQVLWGYSQTDNTHMGH